MAIYPTWQRFTKLWKTVIYPVIDRNVDIFYLDQPTVDEEYEVNTKDPIDDTKLNDIINQLQNELISKGYDVTDWRGESDDCDLTINGKDRYAPYIDISLFTSELDDDEILYGWDDSRWARWDAPQDDFGFKLEYSQWLKDHGIVDNYENIRKAPKNVQKSYCDWIKSTDDTHLWVRIEYVE